MLYHLVVACRQQKIEPESALRRYAQKIVDSLGTNVSIDSKESSSLINSLVKAKSLLIVKTVDERGYLAL